MLRATLITFLSVSAQAVDEQMLLQQQVRSAETFQAALGSIQASLEALDDPAAKLVAKLVSTKRAMDPEVVTVLERIYPLIAEILLGHMAAKNDAQLQLEAYAAAVGVCNENHKEQEANHSAVMHSQLTLHANCRASESLAWTEMNTVCNPIINKWATAKSNHHGSARLLLRVMWTRLKLSESMAHSRIGI
jgi:hypothetical protein